jgi:hypothetical protein
VRDEGAGFNPDESPQPPHGWGLVGMRERAESVGGRFRIDSAPGRGALVEVLVPIPKTNYPGSASGTRRDNEPNDQPGNSMSEENADEYHTVNVG